MWGQGRVRDELPFRFCLMRPFGEPGNLPKKEGCTLHMHTTACLQLARQTRACQDQEHSAKCSSSPLGSTTQQTPHLFLLLLHLLLLLSHLLHLLEEGAKQRGLLLRHNHHLLLNDNLLLQVKGWLQRMDRQVRRTARASSAPPPPPPQRQLLLQKAGCSREQSLSGGTCGVGVRPSKQRALVM